MTVNQEIYGSLRSVLLASGQLDTVIDLFVNNATERMKLLRDAVSRGDLAEVKRIAHSIKGSCGMLGGAECAEVCQAIEDACHPATKTTPAAYLDQLATELKSMSDFLLEDKSGIKPDCCE